MMESYSSSSKLELGNSLLHSVSASNDSSPQSSNGDMKRKTCSGGGGGGGGGGGNGHLIPTSVTGLTSDLSSLYALENLHHHHHHHHSSGLSHHSHHSSHHHNLIGGGGGGGNSSVTSIAPSTSSTQSIQSGSGSLLSAGNALGLPGKFSIHIAHSMRI